MGHGAGRDSGLKIVQIANSFGLFIAFCTFLTYVFVRGDAMTSRAKDPRVPPGKAAIDVSRYRDPILDSINEGVFTVDPDWRITSFNQAAENITGIRREQAIGQRCSEVFRANICEESCALKKTLSTGKPVVDATVFVIDASGNRIPIKISAAVLHDRDGKVIGGVETFQDLRQIEELQKKLRDKHTFADIVGRSPAITRLFDILPRIAESDSTVLIQGASGTGKELFARALHQLSPRRRKRFVALSCGALPDTLLESELFGYMRGAFTDARRDKPGRFAIAEGGTLFLDEIGDVSPAMQVRLLRVLQERVYEPLGSVKPVQTNVRVVAATHRDLRALVQEGAFREDLFYRIHVIHIDIPPLSQRREDIPLLVDHFIGTLNRMQGRHVPGISPEAASLLMEHDYPGNVRELQNILEHAFVLSRGGLIQPHHLPPDLRTKALGERAAAGGGMNIRSVEKVLIREALLRHDGNRARAAEELGINPSTLYRKIRQYGIHVSEKDGRSRP
jgi:PAS domain S-box-containing protein